MTRRPRRRARRSRAELADIECDLPPLQECVRRALRAYFRALDGHSPGEVYELVLSEIEPPLLEVVMGQVSGNLTRAAEMMGINRATLRKKLKKYRLEKSAGEA
ncbi:MAG: DNA-binding transcriptional regulator Fis [Chromatiales bacterium]